MRVIGGVGCSHGRSQLINPPILQSWPHHKLPTLPSSAVPFCSIPAAPISLLSFPLIRSPSQVSLCCCCDVSIICAIWHPLTKYSIPFSCPPPFSRFLLPSFFVSFLNHSQQSSVGQTKINSFFYEGISIGAIN